jgi:hypothetical protein
MRFFNLKQMGKGNTFRRNHRPGKRSAGSKTKKKMIITKKSNGGLRFLYYFAQSKTVPSVRKAGFCKDVRHFGFHA